jgi:WD40 repeat protein
VLQAPGVKGDLYVPLLIGRLLARKNASHLPTPPSSLPGTSMASLLEIQEANVPRLVVECPDIRSAWEMAANLLVYLPSSSRHHRLVVFSPTKRVDVWATDTATLVGELKGPSCYGAFASYRTSDGRAIIAASYNDGTVRLWDGDSLEAWVTVEGHKKSRWSLHACHGPTHKPLLIAASGHEGIRMIDGDTGAVVRCFNAGVLLPAPDLDLRVNGLAVYAAPARGGEPEPRLLVQVGCVVQEYDLGSGQLLRELEARLECFFCIPPDVLRAPRIVAMGREGRVELWDPEADRQLVSYDGHDDDVVCAVAYTEPRGGRARLVTASRDRSLQVTVNFMKAGW